MCRAVAEVEPRIAYWYESCKASGRVLDCQRAGIREVQHRHLDFALTRKGRISSCFVLRTSPGFETSS